MNKLNNDPKKFFNSNQSGKERRKETQNRHLDKNKKQKKKLFSK
jgi:hypothetical protein